jgi:hypothetical protein
LKNAFKSIRTLTPYGENSIVEHIFNDKEIAITTVERKVIDLLNSNSNLSGADIARVMKVSSPNTGGTFSKGDTMEIRYETNLNTTNSEGVALQLYKTTKIAGQAWIPVLTIATKLKEGKYIWSIPTNLEEGEYNIYAVGQGVFAEGVSIGDYSDAPVTIK